MSTFVTSFLQRSQGVFSVVLLVKCICRQCSTSRSTSMHKSKLCFHQINDLPEMLQEQESLGLKSWLCHTKDIISWPFCLEISIIRIWLGPSFRICKHLGKTKLLYNWVTLTRLSALNLEFQQNVSSTPHLVFKIHLFHVCQKGDTPGSPCVEKHG